MRKSCKDIVLAHLEAHKGRFASGAALAAELGLSRNAVWKAVRALQEEGHAIEAVTGKGYRLQASSSILSAASIERHLASPDVHVEFHQRIDSTNNRCKALAEDGAPQGTLVVADCQTAGRGRQGRPFFSPAGSGIYFSTVLRPAFALADVTLITSFAAVCLARAVDASCGTHTQIKWVNDLFNEGHKIAGILTEASFDAESGSVAYVVVGIGVNVFDPQDGFPPDVSDVAKSLCGPGPDTRDVRARIVAGTIDGLLEGLARVPERQHLSEYRKRSLLDGRSVYIEQRGGEHVRATVLGINDDFTLQVRCADGTTRSLAHGEVHIPSSQLQAQQA